MPNFIRLIDFIADTEFQTVLLNALVDLDWEVKEEGLKCFGNILQILLSRCINIYSVEILVQRLKPFCLISAFNICLEDYDRRFLHNTYSILQKLYKYLVENFNIDDLRHKCNDACKSDTNLPVMNNGNQILKFGKTASLQRCAV